jgi:peptidyl-prolyl cis-trans isomerase B (cyclophilin B)
MRIFSVIILLLLHSAVMAQADIKIRKKDRKKDVTMLTDSGTIRLRLSDSTPLHRDNFIRLVKQGFYDSVLFHRVISSFMIQSGDPASKRAKPGEKLGNGGPSYTIPAEFRSSLFHRKGVLAAARQGDQINPQKASSGSQFYIVQGKKFTPAGLDSVETYRLNGRKLPAEHRAVYQTIGGSPHLDQQYTIFGEVVSGLEVIDKIAGTKTSPDNRPLTDIRIIKAKLVKRTR